MNPGSTYFLSASMFLTACASTAPPERMKVPVVPDEEVREQAEIRKAEATLKENIPIGTRFADALARADRLGFTCYPASHAVVDIISIGWAYCTLSCNSSVKSGWWIELRADPHSSQTTSIVGLRGAKFAPSDCRRRPYSDLARKDRVQS
jgi:hypothetical protein